MPIGSRGRSTHGAASWPPDTGGGGGGGGDGDVMIRGDYQQWVNDDPWFHTFPTRSNTINASNYSSLQAAINDASPDTEIVAEAADGPFSPIDIPSTDSITITSPDRAEITGSDRPMEMSGSTSTSTQASIASPISVGDTSFDVDDASGISVGDDIELYEDQAFFGEPGAGGGMRAPNTREYTEVTDISGNTITVDYPIRFPYPTNEPTAVNVVSWHAEDQAIQGFLLDGSGDTTTSNFLEGVKRLWMDDIEVYNGGSNAMFIGECTRIRIRDNHIRDSDRYGFNFSNWSNRCYGTNLTADNIGRYLFRAGASGSDDMGGSNVIIDGYKGTNFDQRTVVGSHHGSAWLDFRDNVATSTHSTAVLRTWYMHLDGVTEDNVGGWTFRTRQRPTHVIVTGSGDNDITNKGSGYVFDFDMGGDTPYGDERGKDLNFEDLDIAAYDGRSITDIGYFNSGCIIDGLHFTNITYAGTQLTRSHVESWTNYGSADITNLTVE